MRLNRSRCYFVVTRGPKEQWTWTHGNGRSWKDIRGHTQTCLRSILSVLFARGQGDRVLCAHFCLWCGLDSAFVSCSSNCPASRRPLSTQTSTYPPSQVRSTQLMHHTASVLAVLHIVCSVFIIMLCDGTLGFLGNSNLFPTSSVRFSYSPMHRYVQGAPIKNNPLEKHTYFRNSTTNLSHASVQATYPANFVKNNSNGTTDTAL